MRYVSSPSLLPVICAMLVVSAAVVAGHEPRAGRPRSQGGTSKTATQVPVDPISSPDAAGGGFSKPRSLEVADPELVHAQVMAWLADRNADESTKAMADALWQLWDPGQSEVDLLELVAHSFALGDDRAKELVALCSTGRGSRRTGKAPDSANADAVKSAATRAMVLRPRDWLLAQDNSPFESKNLRLYYARWLSHQGLYDEMLEQMAGLGPADVIDPASLLFYQGVAHHRLLHKDEGLKVIHRLLDDVQGAPRRYVTLARLMKDDLEALEDESLDHIARRMDDIRRRLELGRAGKKVREVEDGVIKSLDKLIEKMEQQQQQPASAGGGASRPGAPMPDSRIARAQGAGDVNRKNLGKSSGWGDMPAKQREETLQQIGKDFPPHYRDAIEQYFRKLAAEDRR